MATILLVSMTDDLEVVQNIIVEEPENAPNYLVSNGGAYDFALDAGNYVPTPDIGWIYDSGLDTFTDPNAAANAINNLTAYIEQIHSSFATAVALAGAMSGPDVATAISSASGACSSGFTTNESTWFSSACSLVSSGG